MTYVQKQESTALDPTTVKIIVNQLMRKLAPVTRRAVMIAGSSHTMLTINEVCDYIRMSRHQFYRLRRGDFASRSLPPPPFPEARHHGGQMVWCRREIDTWLASLPKIGGMDPRSTI